MLTSKEKKLVNRLRALSSDPDAMFTVDEFSGFLFGLAMTPDVISPSEWLPIVFGGEEPELDTADQLTDLLKMYNRFLAAFDKKKLKFPYSIEKLKGEQFQRVYEWVYGLVEALDLRGELWDPDFFENMPEEEQGQLFFSRMVPEALVNPEGIGEFTDSLRDYMLKSALGGLPVETDDKEVLFQLMLLSALPDAVEFLLNHARSVEKERKRQYNEQATRSTVRSVKVGRNEPCPCNSGKKYKKCCGSGTNEGLPVDYPSPIKKSNVIQGNFPNHHRKEKRKKKAALQAIYQLKVGLKGAKPPIWRRVQVPGTVTLTQLHEIIQISMGWTDTHLHNFIINKIFYEPPGDDWHFSVMPIGSRPRDEAKYTLQDLDGEIQPRFQYVYDFGDDWIHQISVEKVLPPTEGKSYPVLLTGRRACPPEDIGGIYGYMHALQVMGDPENEEYEELKEWLGDFFDPAAFGKEEKAEINKILRDLFKATK